MKTIVRSLARLATPFCLLVTLSLLLAPASLPAALLWDGGATDGNWGSANNWNPDGAPTFGNTQDVTFNGPANGPVGNDTNTYIKCRWVDRYNGV